jgi:hypothetical protein
MLLVPRGLQRTMGGKGGESKNGGITEDDRGGEEIKLNRKEGWEQRGGGNEN